MQNFGRVLLILNFPGEKESNVFDIENKFFFLHSALKTKVTWLFFISELGQVLGLLNFFFFKIFSLWEIFYVKKDSMYLKSELNFSMFLNNTPARIF